MEIYWAIVRMEQDDIDDGVLQVCLQSDDGILQVCPHKFGLVQAFENLFKFIFNCKFQVRPNSIQLNLDEPVKGLNEHCKKYGLLSLFPWFAYSRCPIRKSPVIHHYF